MAFALLEEIKTKEERNDLMVFFDLLLNSLYQKKESSFDSLLESRIPMHFANAVRTDLSQINETKEAYCKNIQKAILEMHEVTLTIAFLPPYSSVKLFAAYIKKEYGPDCYLDITYNPDLIAGATVAYQGIYADISVQKHFLEILLQIKNESSVGTKGSIEK